LLTIIDTFSGDRRFKKERYHVPKRGNRMARYGLEFGETLLDAAQGIVDRGENSEDAGRTVLYLSLLSSEIILKALLEKAGMPVDETGRESHDLGGLLAGLGRCEVEEEIPGQLKGWGPATEIYGKTIIPETTFTVGALLEGQSRGDSKYPNEISYGERVYLFPPVAALMGARILLDWARQKWDRIRRGK
jgi:hypothetical protein